MDRLKILSIGLGIGVVVGVIIGWVLFSVLGAKLDKVNIGPLEVEIPSIESSATFAPQYDVPRCEGKPVNPEDGVVVSLSESVWYVIENYDNRMDPPVHRFITQQGPGIVIADAISGQRAWACTDEIVGRLAAERSARGYKNSHPSHLVYGPDGKEVLP